MKNYPLLTLFFCCSIALYAQSPTDLNDDIAAIAAFNSVTNIEMNFNNARRKEEMQLGLTTNSIKDLDLPDQTTWDNFTDDQKGLFILNDERTARAGVNYNGTAVKGLPFQGVEKKVDDVAQAFADLLYTTNRFDHVINGSSPSNRIDNAITTSCRTFLQFSENLFIEGSSFNSGFVETVAKAIYNWNYEDKSSGWGHRRMNLFQGFTDDNGEANQEGFIGLGVHRGNAYNNTTDFNDPFAFSFGALVVLNYYDPVATANAGSCNYNVTVSTNSLSNSCQAAVTVTSANGNADVMAINTITTSGTVTVSNNATYSAGTSVTLNSGFSVQSGTNFTAKIEACANTLVNEMPVETAFVERNKVAQSNFSFKSDPIAFPNPFNTEFTLQYELKEASTVNIEVLNLNGQSVKSYSKHQLAGFNEEKIDAVDWTPGVYFIRIQGNIQTWTKRLVKK
jgi:hypothetical protein